MIDPQSNAWHYIDVAGLLAILGGLVHTVFRLGGIKVKMDLMWEWWRIEHTARMKEKGGN